MTLESRVLVLVGKHSWESIRGESNNDLPYEDFVSGQYWGTASQTMACSTRHSIGALARGLAAPFPIQFFDNPAGKAMKMWPKSLHACRRLGRSSWLLASAWPNPGWNSCLVEWKISHFFSLSLALSSKWNLKRQWGWGKTFARKCRFWRKAVMDFKIFFTKISLVFNSISTDFLKYPTNIQQINLSNHFQFSLYTFTYNSYVYANPLWDISKMNDIYSMI